MITDNVLKNFIRYIGFNILGQIAYGICIFADYWFISTAMGADGLAALSFALPVFSLTAGLGLMLGVGGGAKYAELRAGGDHHQANIIFTISITIGCLILIPFIIIGLFFSTQTSMLLGATGHILPMTDSYVKVALILSPGLILYLIFESFVRNDDAPKVAMIASVTYSAMNIFWDYVFIIVFDWEMFGAALATTVASFFGLACLLVHWWRKKAAFRLVKTYLEIKQTVMICAIGAPPFVNELLYGFVLLAYNLVLFSLVGNIGVAAFGIVSSLGFIAQNLFIGLGQGLQPMASHYYGKKDYHHLNKVLKYAVIMALSIAAITIAVIFLFTDPITSTLNSDQDAVLSELANDGIRIYFTAFLFFGVTIVAVAFLSVTASQKAALMLSVFQGGALIIPLLVAMAHFWGVTGAWLSYPVSELMLVIFSIFFIIANNKKIINVCS